MLSPLSLKIEAIYACLDSVDITKELNAFTMFGKFIS